MNKGLGHKEEEERGGDSFKRYLGRDGKLLREMHTLKTATGI
jgi:hypothetical protein